MAVVIPLSLQSPKCHPHPSPFSSTSHHDMSLASAAAGGILLCSPGLTASGCACSLSLKRLPSASLGTLLPNLSSSFAGNCQGLFLPKINLKYRSPRLRLVVGAADSTQSSSVTTSADKPTVPDDEISVTKVISSVQHFFFYFVCFLFLILILFSKLVISNHIIWRRLHDEFQNL